MGHLMPMDSTQSYDHFKDRIIGRQLKFTLIPRQCYLTGRTMWLEKAYCVTAMWSGPGSPAYEIRWYDKDEYLVAVLKDLL